MMATEHAPQSPSAQPSFEPVCPALRRCSRRVTFGEKFSSLTGRPFSVNSRTLVLSIMPQLNANSLGEATPLPRSSFNQLVSRQRQKLGDLLRLGHFAEQLCRLLEMSALESGAADLAFDARQFLRQQLVVQRGGDWPAVGQFRAVFEPLPDL